MGVILAERMNTFVEKPLREEASKPFKKVRTPKKYQRPKHHDPIKASGSKTRFGGKVAGGRVGDEAHRN